MPTTSVRRRVLAVQSLLVESAWGARGAGIAVDPSPRPLADPDVPVPEHPALHGLMPMVPIRV